MKKAENKHINRHWFARLAAIVMVALFTAASLPAGFAYADVDNKKAVTEVSDEEPVREVHKVKIEDKKYCFFVTHYVVMTPAEIAKFGDNDAKLTDEVLKRAGLYMKEANCKDEKHTAITPNEWKKKGGTLSLSPVEIYEVVEEEKSDAGDESDTSADPSDGSSSGDTADTPEGGSDADTGDTGDTGDKDGKDSAAETTTGKTVKVEAVEALRRAAPNDGNPVRIYTDLVITTKTPKKGSSEEPKKYSTFKKNSPNTPKLIYIAVATEKDAALGEAICKEKEEKMPDPGKIKDPKQGGEGEETLPEYRTINMTDRSGGPLEPTLKDGDPVTLEWVEPGKKTDADAGKGFFDHAWAIPALAAAAIALAAALILILKRRRETEEE